MCCGNCEPPTIPPPWPLTAFAIAMAVLAILYMGA